MLAKLSTRPGRRRRALATGAALTVLGAGLPAAMAAAPDAASGSALSRFQDQKVAWSKCEFDGVPKDLQCGKVTVPLDYAHPDAGTLDLALARYRATGEKRGSVLLNFGGPGGAGVPELAYGGKEFMELTDGYDVVSFDPRGVGRSSPVSCGDGTDGEGLGILDDDSASDDPQALLAKLKTAAAACVRNSGPVLPHIGTVNAARDMDVIRRTLGDKKLNYLGFSYGTRLGAVYAAQFPHRVGRMVLDGVDTLTEPLAEQGLAGARGQQVALEDFVDWCVEDIACPFGQDPRTAREEVVRLVRSLDEDPVPTDFGPDFTGQDLVSALAQGLYSKELWPSLERALARLVEDGDASGVMAFATGGLSFPVRATGGTTLPTHTLGNTALRTHTSGGTAFPAYPPGGTAFPAYTPGGTSFPAYAPGSRDIPALAPTGTATDGTSTPAVAPSGATPSPSPLVDAEDVPLDNLPAALMAINCADDPDRPTAERITEDLEGLRAAYDAASPVFGQYRLTEVLLCYGRPRGTDYIRDEVKDLDTPEMLLVGTRGDPATPYRWTVETAERLGDSAVVLDNRSEGHTGYGTSKCVHRKVDDFLLYGSLPPDGSSCGPDEDGR